MSTNVATTWEAVIGLEIHVELATKAKAWCGCSTAFGQKENTNVCPVCLGLPGALPVLNEKALEYIVRTGIALNCDISTVSKFDRKSYYYPDLPKAYQISQNDLPLCRNGHVVYELDGEERTCRIEQIHLEEEAGKSIHAGDNIMDSDFTLVDYNRSGIPLIEIVTAPDIRSPEEARLFLEHLRTILRYLDVSDCKMQEGSLRCDANVSLRPAGSDTFGVKTEVKNMNSFRAVQRALEYEVARQRDLLENGEEVVEETRHWSEASGSTHSMRTKEVAYGFLIDPDLPPLHLTEEQIARYGADLPELPHDRRKRFVSKYDLPTYDAGVLTAQKQVADFYEEVVELFADPKMVSNWIMGEVLRLQNEIGGEDATIPVTPAALAELLQLVKKGTIGANVGKEVLEEMFESGKSAGQIVEERGLEQISDTSELQRMVQEVIDENPDPVASFLGGKEQAIGFLVGQVMKKSRGKANPKVANELLREALQKMSE